LACFLPNQGNCSVEHERGGKGTIATGEANNAREISADIWEQIKTAYASGIGLREIARNMNIPAGTILARAKREGWTRQIQSAKALAKREDSAPAVTATEAVAKHHAAAR
jgi:uncharacterized protein YjcR